MTRFFCTLKERKGKLSKELADLSSVQGTAVPDLAQVGVLDQLADLGGGGVLELGGQGADLGLEEGQELVIVGDSPGGQVADQTTVALGGLGVGQDSESSLGFAVLGVTASSPAATGSQKGGPEDEALEEDSASQKTEGGRGSAAEGESAGGGGSGGAKEKGGFGKASQGHEGNTRKSESVHAGSLKWRVGLSCSTWNLCRCIHEILLNTYIIRADVVLDSSVLSYQLYFFKYCIKFCVLKDYFIFAKRTNL